MRQVFVLLVGTMLCSTLAFAQKASLPDVLYPQMIVYNAKLVTMDDSSFEARVGTIAQAMAVRDGKIIATGSNAEIHAIAGPNTKLIDVKGKTVLPGFIGTHEHPLNAGYNDYTVVHHAIPNDDLVIIRFMDYLPPKEQLARFEPMMKEALANAKPGQGILFYFNHGVDGEYLVEELKLLSRSIKREYLDLLAPNNPVYAAGVFNQKAIDMLSALHPTVPDMKRPNFNQTDNFGEGVRDFATVRWMEPDVFMKGNVPAIASIYKSTLEYWASNGYTSISSSAYGFNELRGVDYLDRRGDLPVRYAWAYGGPNYDEEVLRWTASLIGKGSDHLWNVGAWERIGSDCTKAKLQQSWLDAHPEVVVGARRGTRGCNFDPGTVGRELLERLITTGNRVATMHTWGDVDIDNYMDAIEQASKRAGMTMDEIRAKRHAIDHSINAPRLDQIPRMKNLGMVASLNNRFILYQPISEQVVDLYGIEQTGQTSPRKSVTEGGVINSFEIDVSDPQLVFPLIKTGMDRYSHKTGKIFGPSQRVDRTIELKALTRWGAYYQLRENLQGTLEPGKFADFIVLDKDILSIPAEQIPDIKVLMTVLQGKVTHLTSSLASEIGMQPVGYSTWRTTVPRGWEHSYYFEGPKDLGGASCVGAGIGTCRPPKSEQ